MTLLVALTVAIPVALGITSLAMVAVRANRAAERWRNFCVMKK